MERTDATLGEAERGEDVLEKSASVLITADGLPPVFRDGIQLSPTPSDDANDPLVRDII
jgi:hypothetical protein